MSFLRRPIIREWLLLAGVPAALVALFTAPAILTGQIPYFMDSVMQFYPARLAAAAALHRGEFPFWNPTYYCGAPLWANPQWSLGWLGLWPFLAMPRPGVYTFVMAAHLWLGALGMAAWVRAGGMGRGAALAAGAFYLLNGYTWAHWAFGSYFLAMWTGPWSMVMMTRMRESARSGGKLFPRFALISCLALIWAGLLLAGAPQVVWLFALWFGFAAVWNSVTFTLKGNSRAALAYAGALAMAALLAAGLAAPQLLPMLALQSELTRAEALPLDRVTTGALSLAALVRALLGGAGFPEDANTTLYFGAIGLALAVCGLFRRGPSRFRDAAALAIFLLLTLQFLAPLLYAVLPGYARFHDPRRALTVVMPLVCFFIAGGLTHLSALPDVQFRHAALLVFGGLAPFGALEIWSHLRLLGSPLLPPLAPTMGWLPVPAPPAPLLFLISFLLVIALYIALLFRSPRFKTMPASKGRRLATALVCLGTMQCVIFAVARIDAKFIRAGDFYRETETMRLIRKSGARYFAYDPGQAYSYDYTRPGIAAELMPNTGAAFGLRDFQGYDPAIPRAYREFLVSNNIGGDLYPRHFGLVRNPWAPALAGAGVRWAVGDITAFYPAAPRDGLRVRRTMVVPLPDAMPRRMSAVAVSLAAARQPGLDARPWVIVEATYRDGVTQRRIITAPGAPARDENADELIVADLRDQGDIMRAFAVVALDAGREVAAITLAQQLAPGSVLDIRLRLDLAETGHWRRVETADDVPLYESSLPMPPPGAEWSPFDTSRPPRGFTAGMILFVPALIVWLVLLLIGQRSARTPGQASPPEVSGDQDSRDVADSRVS